MWVAAAKICLAFYETAAAAVPVQTDKMFAGSKSMKLPLNEERGTKQLAEPLIEEVHRKNGIGPISSPTYIFVTPCNCMGFEAPFWQLSCLCPCLGQGSVYKGVLLEVQE